MSDPALHVSEADEALHTPGPNDLWSESFYLDCVDEKNQIGVYVRLGRTVNQNVSVYTAAICEKGKPAIMIVYVKLLSSMLIYVCLSKDLYLFRCRFSSDQKAPLPPADDFIQEFKTDKIEVKFHLEEVLKKLRVTNTGIAASHEDHSEPLRGGKGTPVKAGFDLTWHTDGVPFHWRGTTRYELPCHVTGTVTVGDRVINFSGPGQRDHCKPLNSK